MSLGQAREPLVKEGRELLRSMEEILLDAENSYCSDEKINAIFRAVHTIKGSAGLFGLDAVVSFTHCVESLLDHLRNRELLLNSPIITLLLSCCDYIASLLDAVQEHNESIDPDPEQRTTLLGELHVYIKQASVDIKVPPKVSLGRAVSDDFWQIYLRPNVGGVRLAFDARSFTPHLSKLGSIVYLRTLKEIAPASAAINSVDDQYLGFDVALESAASKQEIEVAFQFLRDESQLLIIPPARTRDAYLKVIDDLPASPGRIGEILIKSGALTPRELQSVLARQKAAAYPAPPLGALLVEEKRVLLPMVFAALHKQKQGEDKRKQSQVCITVEREKFNQLIKLVEALSSAGTEASMAALGDCSVELFKANKTVAALARQIRDAALSMQRVSIGEVFQCFSQAMIGISQEYGKNIRTVISGAGTELDRSMVEKLTDLLMHIVRNSIDHGIEASQERITAGKPAPGELRLNAYPVGGSIVIEVSDDGRGLDRQCILARAIEMGVVRADQALSDREVLNLIFQPGVSTAAHLTNLSGRGVGMDVVRRNVEQLEGEIEVFSEPGRGSMVRIRLPLSSENTVGSHVRGEFGLLPMDHVVEYISFIGQPDLDD
ncbi:MAG: CheA signal transduction histidine kinase [Pseudomonas sp.]|nr:CheA signal transduction histidine kinase [Pseudomonas sp.]